VRSRSFVGGTPHDPQHRRCGLMPSVRRGLRPVRPVHGRRGIRRDDPVRDSRCAASRAGLSSSGERGVPALLRRPDVQAEDHSNTAYLCWRRVGCVGLVPPREGQDQRVVHRPRPARWFGLTPGTFVVYLPSRCDIRSSDGGTPGLWPQFVVLGPPATSTISESSERTDGLTIGWVVVFGVGVLGGTLTLRRGPPRRVR
jgi:hypothetical protein